MLDSNAVSNALVVYSLASPFSERLRVDERLFYFNTGGSSDCASSGSNFKFEVKMKQRWAPGGLGGTSLGFGASVYDCSIVLSWYCASLETGLLRDKEVIELGCGPALSSVVCGKLGARVLATDGDEASVDLARENVALNSVESCVKAQKLLWGDHIQIAEAIREFQAKEIAYILASDVRKSFWVITIQV